jgi:hypothetical protein
MKMPDNPKMVHVGPVDPDEIVPIPTTLLDEIFDGLAIPTDVLIHRMAYELKKLRGDPHPERIS